MQLTPGHGHPCKELSQCASEPHSTPVRQKPCGRRDGEAASNRLGDCGPPGVPCGVTEPVLLQDGSQLPGSTRLSLRASTQGTGPAEQPSSLPEVRMGDVHPSAAACSHVTAWEDGTGEDRSPEAPDPQQLAPVPCPQWPTPAGWHGAKCGSRSRPALLRKPRVPSSHLRVIAFPGHHLRPLTGLIPAKPRGPSRWLVIVTTPGFLDTHVSLSHLLCFPTEKLAPQSWPLPPKSSTSEGLER
ncbi:uncharacterized protein LOC128627694 [Artibeus jamaicensis]|uniref:uncharacterized protein LOC128627694 n=1 Tax=Artibeus jamaicensis TaxID=9417 RepID=UPI00235AD3E5|nr:uncharacterized protein LOC128627694 [Artibeus jamaicensis]